MILNGLGRYRRSKLKFIIGILLKFRRRETVLVQNYADYRYFKRFFSQSVQWMPSSGGVYRNVNWKAILYNA